MIGPVGILKNACRYFETVGIMNICIMNVGIMNASQSLSTGCVIEEETIYYGHDIKGEGNVKVKNQQACATLAATKKGALFWTYRPLDKKCFIKNSKEGKKPHFKRVSGNIECGKKLKKSFVLLNSTARENPSLSCLVNIS